MKTVELCKNETCPLRNKCLRAWSPPSRYSHKWKHIDYNEDGTCDYYWPIYEDKP